MSVTLTRKSNKVQLNGTSFDDRHKTGGIVGGTWNKRDRCWEYPATATVVAQVLSQFRDATVDDECRELMNEWRSLMLYRGYLTGDMDPPSSIEHAKLAPWEHQRRAIAFASEVKSTYMALDMGCGKTAVAIHTANRTESRRVLIVCPNTVVDVWPSEFEKHSEIPWHVEALGPRIKGGTKKKLEIAKNAIRAPRCALVINHESVWRNSLGEWILKQDWDLIVVDEAHRAKSPGGKLSRYLARLGRKAERRMALSGTPLPHSPLDAYGQFRFLDPGIFGTSFARFRAKYALMGGFQNYQVVGWQNEEEFRKRYEFLTYTVASEDVQDLPETQHITIPVYLSSREMKHYRQLHSDFVTQVKGGTVTVQNALTKLLRLSQIVSGVVGDDDGNLQQVGDSKERALLDLLEDMPRSEPIVIFTRFTADIEAVRRTSEKLGRSVFEITGRLKQLDEWKRDCGNVADRGEHGYMGKGPILAVNIQSGGVGIDLTNARYCVYYSLGYNLGDYTQSLKRTHRPGQERDVLYYHLIGQGTVDEEIMAALEQKKNVIEMMIGARR